MALVLSRRWIRNGRDGMNLREAVTSGDFSENWTSRDT